MKWQETEVQQLTDQQLLDAKTSLDKIENFLIERKTDPRYYEKFKNQQPPINPVFLDLKAEVNNEITKRNLVVL